MSTSIGGIARVGSDDGIVLTPASGIVSASGLSACITPTSGRKLKIYYLAYNCLADVEAYFQFGSSSTHFLRNNIVAHSVIAKDFHGKLIEGLVDEPLNIVLSVAVSVIWNAFYRETLPNI